MKHISVRIFLSTVGVFLTALLLTWIFVAMSFSTRYQASQVKTLLGTFRQTVDAFCQGTTDQQSEALEAYRNAYDSPVLIFTDQGEIVNKEFITYLRTIDVSVPGGQTATVPVGYLYTVFGTNAPKLVSRQKIGMTLVPLSSCSLYEPLNVVVNDVNFRNRLSVNQYSNLANLTITTIILRTNGIYKKADTATFRAELLYNSVKGALFRDTKPADYLPQICSQTVEKGGESFRVLTLRRTYNGQKCNFVTIQPVVVTGFEQNYLNKVFFSTYSIICVILIIASGILSSAITNPLRALNSTAKSIANMDFKPLKATRRQDEIGQLSDSIRLLSDNLQASLTTLTDANKKLQQSSELAHQNEQRMKQLLAELAHEFKTPLAVITGYLEAIETGVVQDTSTYFSIIQDEIDSLTFIVNEAVELARLQSGTWKVELANNSLSDILHGVRRRFEGRLAAYDYTFVVEESNVIVECDSHRISQVICNFISNAFKYSNEKNYIRIYETYTADEVFIHVENSGSLRSVDEKDLQSRDIIDSRCRLPSQGIGLDIVKQILQAHGSYYSVTSENGMVTFSFPLKIVQ